MAGVSIAYMEQLQRRSRARLLAPARFLSFGTPPATARNEAKNRLSYTNPCACHANVAPSTAPLLPVVTNLLLGLAARLLLLGPLLAILLALPFQSDLILP